MAAWYAPEWDDKTRFLSAAVNDDADMLSQLVASGVSVDTCDGYGEPAVHLAARLEKTRALARLLELGADVHALGPSGSTLAHLLGAYPSTLPFLSDVVRRGVDVNARDRWGQTPLMRAVLRGNVAGARALLRLGANALARDDQGGDAVYHFIAGIYGFRDGEPHGEQLKLLRDLVRLGLDPNAAGPYGKTALTRAAEKGLDDVLALLREEGGRTSDQDASGLTPLQTAVINGQRRAALALLAGGVPLDYFSAVALGRLPAVAEALASDPSLANAVLPGFRTSALSLAIRFGHAEIVRLMLEHDADPNLPDRWTSSLHSAVRHLPRPELLRLLIEHGAQVDAIDGDLNTPLQFAARDGRVDLARLLLEHGADPNAETERGYRVLQFASTDDMRALLRGHGARESGR